MQSAPKAIYQPGLLTSSLSDDEDGPDIKRREVYSLADRDLVKMSTSSKNLKLALPVKTEDLNHREYKYYKHLKNDFEIMLSKVEKPDRPNFLRGYWAVFCEQPLPDLLDASDVVAACARVGIVANQFAGNLNKAGKALNKFQDMESGFGRVITKKVDIDDIIELVESLQQYTRSTMTRYLRHVLMPNIFPFVFIPLQYFYPLVHFTWSGLMTISLPTVPIGQPPQAIQGVFFPLSVFGPSLMVNYTSGGSAGWCAPDLSYSFCPSFSEMTSWALVSNELVICDKSSELNKAGTITVGWSQANCNDAGINKPTSAPVMTNGVVTTPGTGSGNKYYIGPYHFNQQADAVASAAAFPSQWNVATQAYGGYLGTGTGYSALPWGGWLGNSSAAEASLMHVIRVPNAKGAIRCVVPAFNPSDLEHVDGNLEQFKPQPVVYFFIDGSPGGIIDIRVTLNFQGVPQNQFRQKYGGCTDTSSCNTNTNAISSNINMCIKQDKSILRHPEQDTEVIKEKLNSIVNKVQVDDAAISNIKETFLAFVKDKAWPWLVDNVPKAGMHALRYL